MNCYRITGDMLHLLAFVVLQIKIWNYKSCAGISGKSQILYALVFSTRYIYDLFTLYISFYNTSMKILFLFLTYLTVFLIYSHFSKTNDYSLDRFWITPLVIVAAVVTYFVLPRFQLNEFLWLFSIYLEVVAIWPQFYHAAKVGKLNCYLATYLTLLGLYRGFYILNWYYRLGFNNLQVYQIMNSYVPGSLQFAAYVIFLAYALVKRIAITKEDVPYSTKHYQNNLFIIPLSGESLKIEKKTGLGTDEAASLINEKF